MNLYEIIKHFASEGSERVIFTSCLLNQMKRYMNGSKLIQVRFRRQWVYTPYEDNEADDETYAIYNKDYEIIGHEKYKDRRLKGELNDEVELTDLNYEILLVEWRMVKSDIPTEQIELLKDSGVSIESA